MVIHSNLGNNGACKAYAEEQDVAKSVKLSNAIAKILSGGTGEEGQLIPKKRKSVGFLVVVVCIEVVGAMTLIEWGVCIYRKPRRNRFWP